MNTGFWGHVASSFGTSVLPSENPAYRYPLAKLLGRVIENTMHHHSVPGQGPSSWRLPLSLSLGPIHGSGAAEGGHLALCPFLTSPQVHPKTGSRPGLPLVRPGPGRTRSTCLWPPAHGGQEGGRTGPGATCLPLLPWGPCLSSLNSCSNTLQGLRSRSTVSASTGHSQAARWLLLAPLFYPDPRELPLWSEAHH